MYTDVLREKFPGLCISKSKTWSQLTTLGIGTASPCVVAVETEEELPALLSFLSENNIKAVFAGNGSNIVGSDREIPVVVISLAGDVFNKVTVCGNTLVAGCGVSLRTLSQYSGGFAELCGIPGTLGGALAMNAGANGCCIGDKVLYLRGFDNSGRSFSVDRESLVWKYRRGALPESWIITEAGLEYAPCGKKDVETAVAEDKRRSVYTGRSAGCVFRNAGKVSAGMLIEKAGGKGLEKGGCVCSPVHANFIVNKGGASADDFAALAGTLRRMVWENCGVVLAYEVIFADPEDAVRASGNIPAIKAAVLCGGNSNEREVSLRSGAAVAEAAANAGLDVVCVDITECALPAEIDESYIVFPVLHGGFGEDGRIQKLMENAGIAFVGSGSEASAAVMDKITTKKIAEKADIPTAGWWSFEADSIPDTPPEYLTFPLVAKIPCEGSTVGIELIKTAEDYSAAVGNLKKFNSPLLMEKFVSGVEITVPVIGGKAMPVVEIRSPGGFYDYDAKYVYAKGRTQYFCPPEKVTPDEQKKAAELAERFAAVCGCRDLVRVDFIVDSNGVPMLLEGNSLPGFTATSLVPKSAAVYGWSFEELVGRLFRMAYLRKEKHK